MTVPYRLGLHQLTDHCFVWLQPDGSWGLSNAGFVQGAASSALVDTLVDLPHTERFLDALRTHTESTPITSVITTHADADHFFGHQLLPRDVDVIASAGAAPHMNETHLEQVRAMLRAEGPGGDYARNVFTPFDFDPITPVSPNVVISEPTSIDISGTAVELIPTQPAHSPGDMLVWVPEERVLYAGDLLFIDAAPITWAGPLTSWIEVCDQMIAFDALYVVPGHGPVTTNDGIREVRAYLEHVHTEATRAFERGLTVPEAGRQVPLGKFSRLASSGRLVQNIQNVYRHLDPATPPIRVMEEHAAYEQREESV